MDNVTLYDGECEAVPATANVVKGVCTLQLRPRQLRLEQHQHGGDFRLEDGHPHQAPGQPPRQDVQSYSGLRLLDIINTGSEADEEREPSVSCNCQT